VDRERRSIWLEFARACRQRPDRGGVRGNIAAESRSRPKVCGNGGRGIPRDLRTGDGRRSGADQADGPVAAKRDRLRAILLSAGVAAAASLAISAYLGGSLQSELGELQQRISQRRAALRLGAEGTASSLGLLATRKQTTPSSVMVLEALSRALPDSTYVTELRIADDKVQVVGMTQDAPSLIRLMEQSPQFTRATFFAPTTHTANEAGERFHIEAQITAYFGSGS
jgi:general secretion pathway protein L